MSEINHDPNKNDLQMPRAQPIERLYKLDEAFTFDDYRYLINLGRTIQKAYGDTELEPAVEAFNYEEMIRLKKLLI